MSEIQIPDSLTHDCDNCQGLCCVANKHVPEDGFPLSEAKPVGIPCRNLETSTTAIKGMYKCRIHATLANRGWTGCENFTCHGAGQTLTKFFEEIGIKWNKKPESIDDDEWITILGNFYYGYMVMAQVFRFLSHIKKHYGEEAYAAGKKATLNLMPEFSRALEKRDEEIDFVDWLMKKFDLAIKGAITPFTKRPIRTSLEGRSNFSSPSTSLSSAVSTPPSQRPSCKTPAP